MEINENDGIVEKQIREKAERLKIPLIGNLELTPLCNMDCRMCYVRLSRTEMEAQGKMLSCDQWLDIVRQGVDQGMLYLLLTGGEPLLYPEFRRLYRELIRMGLVLRINTNGTLIDESWADFFAEQGIRMMSITLYGKDNASYGSLCRNPQGFTQVIRAARLLKERNIPFRFTCSLTAYNGHQLEEIHRIAKDLDVPFQPAAYMFPPMRRTPWTEQVRLAPEEAASLLVRTWQLKNGTDDLRAPARSQLASLKTPPKLQNLKEFRCHAGRSGFWMNWKGEMQPCGMFDKATISLLEHSFKECWDYIVRQCSEMPQCRECRGCPLQNACSVCPAACYAETGRTDGKPEYLCRMTGEVIRQLEEALKEPPAGKVKE